MSAVDAYPLAWPPGFPRTQAREQSRMSASLAGTMANTEVTLRAFAKESGKLLSDVVVSSNCTLGVTNPDDPGVSLWFTWDGLKICIPVDRYQAIEHNMLAVRHIIEARRVELRYGSVDLVRASFAGFLVSPIPAPAPPSRKERRAARKELSEDPKETN